MLCLLFVCGYILYLNLKFVKNFFFNYLVLPENIAKHVTGRSSSIPFNDIKNICKFFSISYCNFLFEYNILVILKGL